MEPPAWQIYASANVTVILNIGAKLSWISYNFEFLILVILKFQIEIVYILDKGKPVYTII